MEKNRRFFYSNFTISKRWIFYQTHAENIVVVVIFLLSAHSMNEYSCMPLLVLFSRSYTILVCIFCFCLLFFFHCMIFYNIFNETFCPKKSVHLWIVDVKHLKRRTKKKGDVYISTTMRQKCLLDLIWILFFYFAFVLLMSLRVVAFNFVWFSIFTHKRAPVHTTVVMFALFLPP